MKPVAHGLSEKFGQAMSFPLGLFTGTVAFVRQSRMFHPRGLTFRGEVKLVPAFHSKAHFHPHALIRLSSAWWKEKEWIDVLGVAIRFSKQVIENEVPRAGDQDLLFATVRKPWLLGLAPLLTHFHDFLDNAYYAVSPFEVESEKIWFKLHPKFSSPNEGEARAKRLQLAVEQGTALFEIQIQKDGEDWTTVAELNLIEAIELDQEALQFSPFRDGLGFEPVGFVHALRVGAYRFSQAIRPKTQTKA